MRYTMKVLGSLLLAATMMTPLASAETADHDQTCGVTLEGEFCLSNESWNGGFRAFDAVANEPLGTSLPVWMGATSILINPVVSNPGNHGGDERLRDTFSPNNGLVNDNNYANYTSDATGTDCDITSGILTYHVEWVTPLLEWFGVAGNMTYGFDGFWFTEEIWADAFSASELHFTTNLNGDHTCTAGIGNSTTDTIDMTGATAEDYTIYRW